MLEARIYDDQNVELQKKSVNLDNELAAAHLSALHEDAIESLQNTRSGSSNTRLTGKEAWFSVRVYSVELIAPA